MDEIIISCNCSCNTRYTMGDRNKWRAKGFVSDEELNALNIYDRDHMDSIQRDIKSYTEIQTQLMSFTVNPK